MGGGRSRGGDYSDRVLLTAWRHDDRAAVEELFERHYGRVARFFHRKCKEEDQDDLVHSTLLAYLQYGPRFALGSGPRGLARIAHNVLADYLRARRRNTRLTSISQAGDLIEPTTPESEMADSQVLHRVLEAMCRLPVKQRTVLELYYWEAMPEAEMADVLGEPRGIIKTRLRKAHIELKHLLATNLVGAPEDVEQRAADALGAPASPAGQDDRTVRDGPRESRDTVRDIIEADWDDPEPVLRVLDSLVPVMSAAPRRVGLDDVQRVSCVPNLREALMVAEYLASERIGIFVARFELVCHDGRKQLSDEAVYAALRTGVLRDPEIGNAINNWPERVVLSYQISMAMHEEG